MELAVLIRRGRPRYGRVGGIRLRLVRGEADVGTTLAPIGGHEVFPSVSARARALARNALDDR